LIKENPALKENWHFCAAKQVKKFDEIDMFNCKNLIDCLILMANSTKLLKRMHAEDVESLMPLVWLPDTDEWEDTRLRI
jgi:hypothetical protein